MNGFKCSKCSHEMLDPTTVNGWPCPECKSGEMRHAYMVKGGHLEAFAFPGGYPVRWIADIDTSNCATLCADCAMSERDAESIKTLIADIYYEGPSEFCEGCNVEMESAYGDPENPDDD